jgi:hypothetical protein
MLSLDVSWISVFVNGCPSGAIMADTSTELVRETARDSDLQIKPPHLALIRTQMYGLNRKDLCIAI